MLNFFVVFPTFAQTSAKYDDLLTLVIQLISAHIKEDPTVRGCMTRLDLHNQMWGNHFPQIQLMQNAEPSPFTYDVSARARPRLACVSASWQRKPSSDGGSPGGGISLLAPLEK